MNGRRVGRTTRWFGKMRLGGYAGSPIIGGEFDARIPPSRPEELCRVVRETHHRRREGRGPDIPGPAVSGVRAQRIAGRGRHAGTADQEGEGGRRGDQLCGLRLGGLRAVYRTLELPGRNPLKDAHAALDAAVLAAYGFDPKADLLAQLLALNQQVAAKEKAGEKVTPPGVPADYGDATALVTDDCIKP